MQNIHLLLSTLSCLSWPTLYVKNFIITKQKLCGTQCNKPVMQAKQKQIRTGRQGHVTRCDKSCAHNPCMAYNWKALVNLV